MSDFEWGVWAPQTETEREKLGPAAIIDGRGEPITEIDPRDVPRYQTMARRAAATRIIKQQQARDAAQGRYPRYVLDVTPTAQGLDRNPYWQDFGTRSWLYDRYDLERRLERAEVERQTGDISAVTWREMTDAELREIEQRGRDYRQRLGREPHPRGHDRQR
ncbi:hypothetical protein ACL02S_23435 [Nocardia sp. 004]|uniref:hypothetical protein n=1 Tax=Nocardia sp. 004 TaxID=3385978 RepID=UPI0039A21C58